MSENKIPSDRLALATISVLRTLINELSKQDLIDRSDFIKKLHTIAIAHRETGDPNNLADAIHSISEHLADSTTIGARPLI